MIRLYSNLCETAGSGTEGLKRFKQKYAGMRIVSVYCVKTGESVSYRRTFGIARRAVVRFLILRAVIMVGLLRTLRFSNVIRSSIFLIWVIGAAAEAFGQGAPDDSTYINGVSRDVAPRVFLDCDACDHLYTRRELTFVNWVREPELAQVHIFVTIQRTGSGGIAYSLLISGQHEFEGVNNSLTFTSPQGSTVDERRSKMIEILRMSLVPYLARTPLADRLKVSFEGKTRVHTEPEDDPWNSWVFDIDGSGSFNKEESKRFASFSTELSADRVTEELKIRTRVYGDYRERRFEQDDEPIVSTSHEGGFNGSLVFSLDDHWSAGFFNSVQTNTYRNYDLSVRVGPSVEYNVFPYSESSRKEFVFAYNVGLTYRDYIKETIYEKTQETLFNHSLDANMRIQQPWGYVFAGLSGANYFHDLSKNRVEFYSNVSFRLVKGFSLRFSGAFEVIHDQLYLAKGDATLEELLLQQRQLATTYEVRGSVGLSYSFGSIYNNVVNTRL